MSRPGRAPTMVEWADYFAGRLTPAKRRRLDAAADSDSRIAADRQRAERIHAGLASIAADPAPELSWESIGARIHWALSTARRSPAPPRRRLWPVALGLSTAVGVAALALLWLRSEPQAPPAAAARAVATDRHPEIAPASAPGEPLRGVITLVEGEVELAGRSLDGDLAGPVMVGATLQTGIGRIAIQFGEDSAFELGAESRVHLARFDDGGIELDVTGIIDVEVSHRQRHQTFAIRTRGGRVEVRGTRFRVDQQGDNLIVSCTRGEVAVELGSEQVAIAAGQRLRARSGGGSAETLDTAELVELDASLDIPTLAGSPDEWLDSGMVRVDAPGRSVAIDGVEVGMAPLRMRVAPGRHHVALESDGRWAAGSWYRVGKGEHQTIREDAIQRSPRRARPRSRRRAELVRAIEGSGAIRGCLSGLAKRGLAKGAFADIEIGVNADGTQSFLNVLESNLPPDVRRCVRDAVDRIQLRPGPRIELRHRVRF